jgi:magnesium chelatase family protein
MEALRQPLEEKSISVSRAKGSAKFPANFILIAAMNPCPCGNFGIKGRACTCSVMQIERYKRKMSGPIMDRIDLWVEVSRVDHDQLSEMPEKEENPGLRTKINKAREKQKIRFQENPKLVTNGDMGGKDLVSIIKLSEEVKNILNESARRLNISARSYHRLMKVARTIADLEASDEIERDHILEALSYRPKVAY